LLFQALGIKYKSVSEIFPSLKPAASTSSLPSAACADEPRPNVDFFEGIKPSVRGEYSRNPSRPRSSDYWLAKCTVESGRTTHKIIWQSDDEQEVWSLESFNALLENK
jgi:hypothetical protein